MVSTRKKKHQHKKQLSQLKKTLNDFIIGNNINADAIGYETLETQTVSVLLNLEVPQLVKTVQVKLKSLAKILPTRLEMRLIILLYQ